jgi:hypothetical protein
MHSLETSLTGPFILFYFEIILSRYHPLQIVFVLD